MCLRLLLPEQLVSWGDTSSRTSSNANAGKQKKITETKKPPIGLRLTNQNDFMNLWEFMAVGWRRVQTWSHAAEQRSRDSQLGYYWKSQTWEYYTNNIAKMYCRVITTVRLPLAVSIFFLHSNQSDSFCLPYMMIKNFLLEKMPVSVVKFKNLCGGRRTERDKRIGPDHIISGGEVEEWSAPSRTPDSTVNSTLQTLKIEQNLMTAGTELGRFLGTDVKPLRLRRGPSRGVSRHIFRTNVQQEGGNRVHQVRCLPVRMCFILRLLAVILWLCL